MEIKRRKSGAAAKSVSLWVSHMWYKEKLPAKRWNSLRAKCFTCSSSHLLSFKPQESFCSGCCGLFLFPSTRWVKGAAARASKGKILPSTSSILSQAHNSWCSSSCPCWGCPGQGELVDLRFQQLCPCAQGLTGTRHAESWIQRSCVMQIFLTAHVWHP